MQAELEVIAGPDVGRTARFDRSSIVIGRHPECDFVLTDASASRRHAILRWEGNDGIVSDLGSRHGALLDGQLLDEERRFHGQVDLTLGNTLLRVTPLADDPLQEKSSLSHAFAAGAFYRVQPLCGRAVRYSSEGPQPSIAQLLVSLSDLRTLCLLVDPLAKDDVPLSARAAGRTLLSTTPDAVDPSSPIAIPAPEAFEAASALECSDHWVAYFGDSWDELVQRLQALARHRATVDDTTPAPVLLPLWKPSLLMELIHCGEEGFAEALLTGIRAALLEHREPGAWDAIATDGFREALEHFGFRPYGATASSGPRTG